MNAKQLSEKVLPSVPLFTFRLKFPAGRFPDKVSTACIVLPFVQLVLMPVTVSVPGVMLNSEPVAERLLQVTGLSKLSTTLKGLHSSKLTDWIAGAVVVCAMLNGY